MSITLAAGWPLAQEADFILGPVLVGLYWLWVRPDSRFGWLLIGFGFVGVAWEAMLYLGTLALILTFPTGRLDGRVPRLILVLGIGLTPLYGEPSRAVRVGVIVVALATAGLLVWRMFTGTPPQRRAQAIGAPVALVFTVAQATDQALQLAAPAAGALDEVQWVLAGARSLIWYGFLFALIAAQLFAGRALHELVRQSARRPSRRDLESLLRVPLGDPDLRLAFWEPGTATWGEAPEAGDGRDVTVIERADGRPAVALLHDARLNDDPELLRAAGAVALLAAENAELDEAWRDQVDELRRSRVRIMRAGDSERSRIERNLHDGVQQRLVAIHISIALAGELVEETSPLRGRLEAIGDAVQAALDELRDVSHGFIPPVLERGGLVAALEHTRRRSLPPFRFRVTELGRLSPDLEATVYYCCLEAIQNATQHGGPDLTISLELHRDGDHLCFDVTDDGRGVDSAAVHDDVGLQNLRDRLGAVDGELSILTAPGHGTIVSGTVPLLRTRDAPAGDFDITPRSSRAAQSQVPGWREPA